jgi:glycosyltransferase involved in cell wall biosynthesis
VDALEPPSDGRGGYVVFAGRLSEEKGVRTLVHAWRNLRHIPLKILGDGPLLPELRQRVAADGLPIEFPGMMPREEVLKIIGGAEFQVIASECFEGFPLVLVESYSRGTPVLASRIGSLEELVQPGVTGAHFIPGEPASLAAEARRLWADASLLRRLRVGARLRFEERYTPARNLDTLLGIYARVTRQRAPAPNRVSVAVPVHGPVP